MGDAVEPVAGRLALDEVPGVPDGAGARRVAAENGEVAEDGSHPRPEAGPARPARAVARPASRDPSSGPRSSQTTLAWQRVRSTAAAGSTSRATSAAAAPAARNCSRSPFWKSAPESSRSAVARPAGSRSSRAATPPWTRAASPGRPAATSASPRARRRSAGARSAARWTAASRWRRAETVAPLRRAPRPVSSRRAIAASSPVRSARIACSQAWAPSPRRRRTSKARAWRWVRTGGGMSW